MTNGTVLPDDRDDDLDITVADAKITQVNRKLDRERTRVQKLLDAIIGEIQDDDLPDMFSPESRNQRRPLG